MSLKDALKFMLAVTALVVLAGCASFTCDELSNENKLISIPDRSAEQKE